MLGQAQEGHALLTRGVEATRDQGKPSKALDVLGPIYNWFTEGFDAPDLRDAKALLDELATN